MPHHELKIIRPFFADLIEKRKRFELRKNDRNFKIGDTILFNEVFDKGGVETGRCSLFEVTYILFQTKVIPGLLKDYVVLGIEQRNMYE